MISQFERFGFLGEVHVYTFRNLFKNQVPLGLQLALLHNYAGDSLHESSVIAGRHEQLGPYEGLCCTNRFGDSLYESSMIAGGHE